MEGNKTDNFATKYGLNVVGAVEQYFMTRQKRPPECREWSAGGKFCAALNVFGKELVTEGHWNKKSAKNQVYSEAYEYLTQVDADLSRATRTPTASILQLKQKSGSAPLVAELAEMKLTTDVSGFEDRLVKLEKQLSAVVHSTNEIITGTNRNIDVLGDHESRLRSLETTLVNLEGRIRSSEGVIKTQQSFLNDLAIELGVVKRVTGADKPVDPAKVDVITKKCILNHCIDVLKLLPEQVQAVYPFLSWYDIVDYYAERGIPIKKEGIPSLKRF
jgi:hypothetical protein